MSKYFTLVTVRDPTRNEQAVESVLRNLDAELDGSSAELEQCYAVLGEYDFILIIDAPDRDAAFRASIAIENQGLDTQTMEIIPIEEFASLVQD